MPDIVLFGLGGVGSWLAEFLARLPEGHEYAFKEDTTNTLHLVDFDKVEEKNIKRQNFNKYCIAGYKTDMVGEIIERLGNFNVRKHNRKVEKMTDIVGFDRNSLAIICTDNTQSKKLIASYFKQFVLCNCEKDYYEIKNMLDDDEKNALSVGDGYASTQTFTSNITCAAHIFRLLECGKLFENNICEYL